MEEKKSAQDPAPARVKIGTFGTLTVSEIKIIISYWIRLQDLASKDPDPTKWKLPSKNNQLFASLGQAAWRAGHGVQACGACSGPSLSSAVLLTHTHRAPFPHWRLGSNQTCSVSVAEPGPTGDGTFSRAGRSWFEDEKEKINSERYSLPSFQHWLQENLNINP